MDRILPYFIYALIMTRSSLGLLTIIFRKFVTELWLSIYIRVLFPLNIVRTNYIISTNFIIKTRISFFKKAAYDSAGE